MINHSNLRLLEWEYEIGCQRKKCVSVCAREWVNECVHTYRLGRESSPLMWMSKLWRIKDVSHLLLCMSKCLMHGYVFLSTSMSHRVCARTRVQELYYLWSLAHKPARRERNLEKECPPVPQTLISTLGLLKQAPGTSHYGRSALTSRFLLATFFTTAGNSSDALFPLAINCKKKIALSALYNRKQ